MKLHAVIIDDETKPAEGLFFLLNSLDMYVNCVGTAHNVLDGIKLINTEKPDIVFLDINMPTYNGFDLLNTIGKRDFLVVFTTAHEEYAIKSVKHQAFDYLLKPIDVDELKACLVRAKEYVSDNEQLLPDVLKVPVKDGLLFIKHQNIVRIEADGNYCTIHLIDGTKHLISKNLKIIENMLDKNVFFRCHNSHLINLKEVTKFFVLDGYYLEMSDNSKIEVSRSKKDELLGLL